VTVRKEDERTESCRHRGSGGLRLNEEAAGYYEKRSAHWRRKNQQSLPEVDVRRLTDGEGRQEKSSAAKSIDRVEGGSGSVMLSRQ